MIQTCRPFDSVRFSTGGSFNAGSGPSAGGFDRSGRLLREDRRHEQRGDHHEL